jgi:pyruvate dehydrogenase E1 component alpha subunit/2-oxoisovalerate dehydrogenase E1 component alpha subunit
LSFDFIMPEQTIQTAPDKAIGDETILEAFRWMVLGRTFEDKIGALYRAGKVVGGVYLGRGQEAFSVSLGMQLRKEKGDVFAPMIRDQSGRAAFGEPLIDAARTYLGSVEGPMRGRDGNIHRGRPREGQPAMISHLGSSVSIVNGYLVARRFHEEAGQVGAVCAGDGMTSTGAFHEGLNQAAVEKLPLVVAVANNQFAYSTPVSRQFACDDLADRAAGYGIEALSIDGTDLNECLVAFSEVIAKARSGEGPQMVVGKLLRLTGHGEHDDATYVPDSARAGHYGRDCNEVARSLILEKAIASEADLVEIEGEAQARVEEAVAKAQSEEGPDPAKDDWKAISSDFLADGFEEGG